MGGARAGSPSVQILVNDDLFVSTREGFYSAIQIVDAEKWISTEKEMYADFHLSKFKRGLNLADNTEIYFIKPIHTKR